MSKFQKICKSAFGLDLSLITIFLGHGTALISVATTEIFAGLQKLDRAQEEASLDLGATPWPTSPAEIKAFRDAEETRLLPIMKAAGIKPE